MIGIYQDNFSEYIKDNLGYVKQTSKNLITRCPWCEYNKNNDKDHYHMYISLEAPMFHCFHANCEESGTLRKLLKKIEGRDISDSFIDKAVLEKFKKQKAIFDEKEEKILDVIIPELKENSFVYKDLYIKKRLKFSNISTSSIKGLVYDVEEFIKQNKIPIDETLFRLKDYLHNNFVGFVTEHNTTIIFRNIDHTHSMKFFKLKIRPKYFLDYYKLFGNNPNSKKIVLAEGIFDIFTENIYDHLNIKKDVKLYASALSSKFSSLLYSIVFYEQIFRPDVIILADQGIPLSEYEKLKKYNKHIINSLTVYYNKSGKDFADSPVSPVKYIL